MRRSVNSQLMRTLRTDVKRCMKLLPGLFVTSLLFLFVFGIIIHYYTSILFQSDSFQKIDTAVYIPDDSQYNQLGFSMVSGMESFEDSVNLIPVESPKQGYEMLEKKEVTVFLIVPEQFISGILSGENHPVRIVLRNEKTFETYVMNDLLQSVSSFLGCAQAAVYTAYDICMNHQLPAQTTLAFQNRIDTGNLAYVLSREEMFTEEPFDTLHAISLTKQLTVSSLLLILFMSCFVLTAFYKGNNHAYYLRQKNCGISKPAIILTNSAAGFVAVYIVYLLLFTALCLTGMKPSLLSLVTMIPVIFLISLIIRLFSELSYSPHIANLMIFLTVLLLTYLAGGLMPIQFLPKFLQNTVFWNPMAWLIRFSQTVIF